MKIVNFVMNVGVLMLFILYGLVLWLLGGIFVVVNVVGSYFGLCMVILCGIIFICVVFLVVVVVFIVKLGVDVWNENIVFVFM